MRPLYFLILSKVSSTLWVPNGFSCDLWCLSVADLDSFQSESPGPQDTSQHGPQPQILTTEAKLTLPMAARHGGDAGDGAEENIVYLWVYVLIYCFPSKQIKTLALWGETSLGPSPVCVIVCAQIALRRIFNISCKFILLGIILIIKLLKNSSLCIIFNLSHLSSFQRRNLTWVSWRIWKSCFDFEVPNCTLYPFIWRVKCLLR